MTLQPTYRLLWGSAGSSNALDIATALGFDPAVLFEARILARAELGRQEETLGRMEQVCRPPLVQPRKPSWDTQVQVCPLLTCCLVQRSLCCAPTAAGASIAATMYLL